MAERLSSIRTGGTKINATFMEDNIKPYSAEELNTRLDRVNSWIDNCDQKAVNHYYK